MNMLERISIFSEKKPYYVILVIILITVILGAGATKVEMSTNQEDFLPKDSDSIIASKILQDEFGGQLYENILLKGDVTSLDGMYAIQALEQKILSDEILKGFVLSTISYLDPLIEAGRIPSQVGPQTPYAVQAILEADKMSESPLIVGRMITSDYKKSLLLIRVASTNIHQKDALEKTAYLREMVKVFSEENNGIKASITGSYTIGLDSSDTINKDNKLLMPLAVLFIVVLLFIIFRRISDAMIPFATIGISLIWIGGIMGYVGILFSAMFVAIAPLLLGITIDYAMHIIFRYNEERRKGESIEFATRQTLSHTGTAVFLSAGTTVFGFLSFGISKMPPMRDFGFLAVLGIIFSFILVTTFLPAVTVLRDRKKDIQVKSVKPGTRIIEHALKKIVRMSQQHKTTVLSITLLVTIISLSVSPLVETSINWEDMVPGELESIKTAEEIETYFRGATGDGVILLVEGDLLSPESLAEIVALEQELRQLEAVNEAGNRIVNSPYAVQSYADLIIQANGGILPSSSLQAETILEMMMNDPETKNQISSLIVLDKNSENYCNIGILKILTDVHTEKDMKNAVHIVRETVENHDMALSYRAAGNLAIIADLFNGMTSTQVQTTMLALLLCFIVVTLLFRSLFYGILSLLPVVLTISWDFLSLWLFGWAFDLFTIMISALIIGLGIDYAVHFIHRFREEIKNGSSTETALDEVATNIGKALISTTITTAGAFIIIGFSMMPILSRFGILTAMTVISSFSIAIFILPALLAWHNDRAVRE
ncbi:MAG: efflux RND transporter permease subunit [Candidatus Methanofastidiosia archaeon]